MVNLFFLQVKFQLFLKILETFKKTIFLTVFKKTVIKIYISKISKKDRNLTCKKHTSTINSIALQVFQEKNELWPFQEPILTHKINFHLNLSTYGAHKQS